MDTHFICLANSYKRGGRCIAGVEIDIDANDCWSVKRKADVENVSLLRANKVLLLV